MSISQHENETDFCRWPGCRTISYNLDVCLWHRHNGHVSLHHGPRAFVITGPARALYGLVTNLRKVRGLDQSKTPFSQRKLVFSVRFLTANAPYHSEYLASGIDRLCEDLGGEELWTAKELGIPVYNTKDGMLFLDIRDPLADLLLGMDMRKLTTSVTRSL